MRRVVVFGAGKSGVAAAGLLARKGVDVTITDSRSEAELPLVSTLDPSVHRVLGSHPDSLFEGADTVILSPGIPADIAPLRRARELGIPVISEIELAFRHLRGKVVAITGSNGKSTTTALIGEILREAGMNPVVAGNIGEPLTAALRDEDAVYVIELSSFQLETVDTFHADIALLLNITPDHMDRYETIDDYAAAKYRIFRNQTGKDLAIVNADDARTAYPPTDADVRGFSSSREQLPGAWFDDDDLVLVRSSDDRVHIPRTGLRLAGTANVENALAAWLAADALGVSPDVVRRTFATFAGLPHRMVPVRELGGVTYINDSKGTNVDATLKSLEGMHDGRVILILGGKDKAGEFERLRALVTKKTRAVLTIGSAAKKIEEQLEGASQIVPCGDMATAVQWGRDNAREGDTVLLSPACASFDQYQNFEHRGRHFEELVNALEDPST